MPRSPLRSLSSSWPRRRAPTTRRTARSTSSFAGAAALALGEQHYTARAIPPGGAGLSDVDIRGRDVGLEHPRFMTVGVDLAYARRYFALGTAVTWGFAGAFDAKPLDPQLAQSINTRNEALSFGEYAAVAELRLPVAPATIALGVVAGGRLTSISLEGFGMTETCSGPHRYETPHPCAPNASAAYWFAGPRLSVDFVPLRAAPGLAFGLYVGGDAVPAITTSMGIMMTIRGAAGWRIPAP